MEPDFGALSPIQYFALKKLYWGKYPYKVSVRVPDEPVKISRKRVLVLKRRFKRAGQTAQRKADTKELLRLIEARNEAVAEFTKARTRNLPQDGPWRSNLSDGTKAINFYFVDETQFETFVSDNLEFISEVHRPTSQSEVTALIKQVAPRTRTELVSTLYWAKYRYKVVMKKLDADDIQSIYDWYNQCFDTDELRNQVWLGGNAKPILYLNTETELMFSMLGIRQFVSHIFKAILKEEIVA